MPQCPLVHRQIPQPPESADILGVPPVLVEVPVSEVEELSHGVEEGVETEIKPAQPQDVIGNLKRKKKVYSDTC